MTQSLTCVLIRLASTKLQKLPSSMENYQLLTLALVIHKDVNGHLGHQGTVQHTLMNSNEVNERTTLKGSRGSSSVEKPQFQFALLK